jgi:hypothetical protein
MYINARLFASANSSNDDGTLSNFIKRKHQKKNKKKEKERERERKGNKRPGAKSRQANSPTKTGHKEEREPLRTEPSTNRMKQIN